MNLIYNVKVSVVELVEAESEKEAADILRTRLNVAGFDVYEGDEPDAFESEPN